VLIFLSWTTVTLVLVFDFGSPVPSGKRHVWVLTILGIHHGVHTTLDDCLDLVGRRISGIEKIHGKF
jgi:hypothetical protein